VPIVSAHFRSLYLAVRGWCHLVVSTSKHLTISITSKNVLDYYQNLTNCSLVYELNIPEISQNLKHDILSCSVNKRTNTSQNSTALTAGGGTVSERSGNIQAWDQMHRWEEKLHAGPSHSAVQHRHCPAAALMPSLCLSSILIITGPALVNTHTHRHPFNGPFSGLPRWARYQKGKTNLDFTEARDSEWQWHQLGHMQVCTLLQTDNHASTPPLCVFLQAGCP